MASSLSNKPPRSRVHVHKGRVYFYDVVAGRYRSFPIEEIDLAQRLASDHEELSVPDIRKAQAQMAEAQEPINDGAPSGQEEYYGGSVIDPSKFAQTLLAKKINEEDLYLAAGGTPIFQKIVRYRPLRKSEPFGPGISPYPFPSVEHATIDHNLEEMCEGGPFQLIILGGGEGTKERKLRGAVEIINLEIASDYARIFEGNVPNSRTIITSFMDFSENGILTPRVFEKLIGRPNGLRRIFTNLGGFWGNPPLSESINLLRHVRQLMQPEDLFLLGFDSTDKYSLLEKIYGFTSDAEEDLWEDWGARTISFGLTKRLKFVDLSRRDLHRVTSVRPENGHHVVRLNLDTSQHPELQFQNSIPDILRPVMTAIQKEFRQLNPEYLETRRTPADLAHRIFREAGYRLVRRRPEFKDRPYRPPDDNPYIAGKVKSFIWPLGCA